MWGSGVLAGWSVLVGMTVKQSDKNLLRGIFWSFLMGKFYGISDPSSHIRVHTPAHTRTRARNFLKILNILTIR